MFLVVNYFIRVTELLVKLKHLTIAMLIFIPLLSELLF